MGVKQSTDGALQVIMHVEVLVKNTKENAGREFWDFLPLFENGG